MNRDIGKKVKWEVCDENGTGTLMAVDCEGTYIPHLVQRDDGKGWELNQRDWSCRKALLQQGVKEGTPHLKWVSSYEVIKQPMKTIDDCEAGDVLIGENNIYRIVHVRIGDLLLVTAGFFSLQMAQQDGSCFAYTIETLKADGYSLYSPTTRTAEDVLATLPEDDREILRKVMK